METNAGKRHVLIVDDNLELADTFKQLLEVHGYDVTVTSNGVLALKHILHRTVDAVVCDLKMPQLEGDMFFTTVERLNPALARRFIFITGVADDPHFQKFIAHVKAPLLRKPVPVEKLLEALNSVLQDHP
jgi:CheY-like chemotaxis protein